jgi:uncharacterized membrane protein HdeD (DUF308 family)
MAHQWNERLAAGSEAHPGGFAAWIAGTALTREQLKRAHTWLVVLGVLALLAGLVSIVVPAVTSVTMTIFTGWVLLFSGVALAVNAVSNRALWRGLEALVTLIAALYLLIFPLSGTITLTFVLAAWLFASGVLSLIAAWQLRPGPEWGMAAFGGLVSLALGVLIAVELPNSAAWAIGLLVGVNLIFWSIRALIGARLLKQQLDAAPIAE